MKKLQRLLALISAFSIVLSILVVSAEINYDKNNGYGVGEGVVISSTQMFNDGLVSNSGSNVKYDTGSSKTGTITFDGDSSDKRVESVTKILESSINMTEL